MSESIAIPEPAETFPSISVTGGPDLTTIGNRLNFNELKIRIVNGGKNMPAYGGILSKDEIGYIVSFLSSQK